DAGVKVDLSNGANQTVQYYYDWGLFHTTGTDVRLRVANANSARGTQFDDILIGAGGRQADGEGYSTLYGGQGDDVLVGKGWESHLYGEAGADEFQVGAGSWVEDAEAGTGNYLTYADRRLYGGLQPWWLESPTAIWSPFSAVMNAFP